MGQYDEDDRFYNSEQRYRRLHKRESDLSDKIYDKGEDNMELATRNNSRLGVAIIVLVLFVYGIAQTVYLFGDSSDKKECIEWGVEITNPDGTKEWAKTPATPKDEAEAEYFANVLESQDRGGRYYDAKCKRYKK